MTEFDQTIVNFQRWEVSLRAGKKALAEGDYDEAERQLTAAMTQAGKLQSGDPRIANISCALADLYYRQNQFEKAEEQYKQVMEIWEATLGSDYEGLIPVLENYSKILHNFGRREESIAAMNKVDKIRAKQQKSCEP